MSIDDMIDQLEAGQANPGTTIIRVILPYKERKNYGLTSRKGLEGDQVHAFAVGIGEAGRQQYFYDYSLRKAVQKAYDNLVDKGNHLDGLRKLAARESAGG